MVGERCKVQYGRLCNGEIDGGSVNRGRVDLLAGLVDLIEDLVELEAAGDDLCALVLEGDLVLVDAYIPTMLAFRFHVSHVLSLCAEGMP